MTGKYWIKEATKPQLSFLVDGLRLFPNAASGRNANEYVHPVVDDEVQGFPYRFFDDFTFDGR